MGALGKWFVVSLHNVYRNELVRIRGVSVDEKSSLKMQWEWLMITNEQNACVNYNDQINPWRALQWEISK